MKILIVDDHPLVRQGVKQVLHMLEPEQVMDILEAGDGQQAMHVARLHPDLDLILLDFDLPDKSGLAILIDLGRYNPEVPVLMLSASQNPTVVKQTIQQGAAGFASKSGDSVLLLNAVRHVLAGNIYLPDDMKTNASVDSTTAHHAKPTTAPQLTQRQQSVLSLLVAGLSNREIGERLHLSEETIKSHVSMILRALKVQSRVEAVTQARMWGYLV